MKQFALLLACGLLAAQQAERPRPRVTTWKVGPGETHKTPCLAIYAAAPGDTIEIAPGTYAGASAVCFVPKALIIRSADPAARVVLDARDSNNNAWNVYSRGIWAVELPDNTATLDVTGVDFVGAAISDSDGHNGAGMRITRGNVRCTRCGFFYGQNGILTSANAGKVELVESFLSGNGTGGGYEHNLYIQGAEFVLRHSAAVNSYTGQAIKCRSPKCTIEYNWIGESAGKTNGNTNVEVEMPNGGTAVVRGNVILQSPDTANSHVISMGTEGLTAGWTHSSTISNNTIVGYRQTNAFFRHQAGSSASYPGTFVLTNNIVAGEQGGTYYEGKTPSTDTGNFKQDAIAGLFVADSQGDYHVAEDAPAAAKSAGAYPSTPLAEAPPEAPPVIPYARPANPTGYQKLAMPPVPPDPEPEPPTPSTGGELVGVITALPPNTVGAVIKNPDGSYSIVLTPAARKR